jgi:hypothetical protein
VRRLLLIYRPRVSLRRGSGRAGGRSRTARVRWTMAWRDEGGEEGGRRVRSRAIDRGDRPSFEARGRVVGDRGPSSSRARGRPGRRGANAEASGRAPLPTASRAGAASAAASDRSRGRGNPRRRRSGGCRRNARRGNYPRAARKTRARQEVRTRARTCASRGSTRASRAPLRVFEDEAKPISPTTLGGCARRRRNAPRPGRPRAQKSPPRKPSAEKHPRVQVGGLVAGVRLSPHAPE